MAAISPDIAQVNREQWGRGVLDVVSSPLEAVPFVPAIWQAQRFVAQRYGQDVNGKIVIPDEFWPKAEGVVDTIGLTAAYLAAPIATRAVFLSHELHDKTTYKTPSFIPELILVGATLFDIGTLVTALGAGSVAGFVGRRYISSMFEIAVFNPLSRIARNKWAIDKVAAHNDGKF